MKIKQIKSFSISLILLGTLNHLHAFGKDKSTSKTKAGISAFAESPQAALRDAKLQCEAILAGYYSDELMCSRKTVVQTTSNGLRAFYNPYYIYSRKKCIARGTRLTARGYEAEYNIHCVEYKRESVPHYEYRRSPFNGYPTFPKGFNPNAKL